MPTLADRVRAKDYTVTLVAGGADAAQVDSLAQLLGDRDEDVRELALLCLNEIGGPVAERSAISRLLDGSIQVRRAAVQGIQRHATSASAPALLGAYDRSGEPLIRRNIALVLGKVGVGREELRERCDRERSAEAREGCMVALARLGDEEKQGEFVRALERSFGKERTGYLEHAEFIGAPWLLGPLLPLLDDPSPAVRIGADGIPFVPEYLRVCDVALNLIAAIARLELSFPVDRKTNYTPAQIEEARAKAQRLVEERAR